MTTNNEHKDTTATPPAGGKGILIIDNYDSFTYNLVHLVNEIGLTCDVWRNDKFSISDVDAYDRIILSPGPGIPREAGLLMEVIEKYAPVKRIFGVCLGQQAIAEVFGGSLYNLNQPMHGIATPIKVTDKDERLFAGLPESFKVGRYHSWVVNGKDLPEAFRITAIDEADNSLMAISHREYDVKGVQFHPESILTEYGKEMMKNWLS
ncbi:MAG TPA: aminodeoxychorismate/anthranilate synthase component II [Mucilaginibacter sp.]|nr:aminodeoxychorismate/anthranilate synthase component II [Mucilaginibacter sp.]